MSTHTLASGQVAALCRFDKHSDVGSKWGEVVPLRSLSPPAAGITSHQRDRVFMAAAWLPRAGSGAHQWLLTSSSAGVHPAPAEATCKQTQEGLPATCLTCLHSACPVGAAHGGSL